MPFPSPSRALAHADREEQEPRGLRRSNSRRVGRNRPAITPLPALVKYFPRLSALRSRRTRRTKGAAQRRSGATGKRHTGAWRACGAPVVPPSTGGRTGRRDTRGHRSQCRTGRTRQSRPRHRKQRQAVLRTPRAFPECVSTRRALSDRFLVRSGQQATRALAAVVARIASVTHSTPRSRRRIRWRGNRGRGRKRRMRRRKRRIGREWRQTQRRTPHQGASVQRVRSGRFLRSQRTAFLNARLLPHVAP